MEDVILKHGQIVKHDSPIPYYFQLSTYIEQEIKSKRVLPGQLMPSEQEIGEKLNVSRTVVRQAMADLERKGLITKQSGKRSAIAHPKYDGSLMPAEMFKRPKHCYPVSVKFLK